MAARDAIFISLAILYGLNAVLTVSPDDCWRSKTKKCVDEVPPSCYGKGHHVNCAEQLLESVRGCDELVVRLAKGKLRSLLHMGEVVCEDKDLKNAFDKNPQCWKSVSECVIPFTATPFSYEDHDIPTESDCQSANLGLTSCIEHFSSSCDPEIAEKFIERMRSEMPTPCGSCVNRAFHVLTLIVFAVVVFSLSN